ncbi:MAG TPA: hypothetical protein VGQ81_04375 [Acidobacteriota bacterium]|nr:hypothetical protein [Acidobacteriota bacterium]
MTTRSINLTVALLLAAAAFFFAYYTRNLQFHTTWAFAGVLFLLGLGTFFAATTSPSTSQNRPWIYKASGLLFLSYFFGFFVHGLMLWNGVSSASFQARLFWLSVGGTAILGLLQLYYQYSSTSDYLQRLHANTFYFGLIFLMSAGMMKYRDPGRVDAIGTVSFGLFCLIQAIGLLKR